MTAVVKGMSRFVQQHPSIKELHTLFSTFLRLLGPLVYQDLEYLVPSSNLADTTRGRAIVESQNRFLSHHSALDNILMHSSGNLGDQSSSIQPDTGDITQERQAELDNDLMWDLLDFQPWLGWSKSDMLEYPRVADP